MPCFTTPRPSLRILDKPTTPFLCWQLAWSASSCSLPLSQLCYGSTESDVSQCWLLVLSVWLHATLSSPFSLPRTPRAGQSTRLPVGPLLPWSGSSLFTSATAGDLVPGSLLPKSGHWALDLMVSHWEHLATGWTTLCKSASNYYPNLLSASNPLPFLQHWSSNPWYVARHHIWYLYPIRSPNLPRCCVYLLLRPRDQASDPGRDGKIPHHAQPCKGHDTYFHNRTSSLAAKVPHVQTLSAWRRSTTKLVLPQSFTDNLMRWWQWRLRRRPRVLGIL